MIEKVKKYIYEKNIIDKHIVIGVSGGADSISLLYCLNLLKEEYNLNIVAAYVNHGIRSKDENYNDFKLIHDLCEKLNITLKTKNIKNKYIENMAIENSSSIEVEARNIRYEFFESICDKDTLIAVGHNKDDQIETQIMRIFQGSSLEGLLGIKSENNNIIRPLLTIEKKEIISFLNDNSISYLVDKTNLENDYLRNKVRNTLIPVIENIFPAYKKSLTEFDKTLSEIKFVLTKNKKLLYWEKKDNYYYISYFEFISLTNYERKSLVFEIFDLTYKGHLKSYRLPNRFIKPLEKNTFNNNETILDGHGFCLVRSSNKIIWKSKLNKIFFYKLKINKYDTYKNSKIIFEVSKDKGINLLGCNFPFYIRTYKEGLPESYILKKLRIPFEQYEKLLIIEKNNTIYAIMLNDSLLYNLNSEQTNIFINFIEV